MPRLNTQTPPIQSLKPGIFFNNAAMWNKIKKWFNRWPKHYHITVRDGDCQLLGSCYITVKNYAELMEQGSKFTQEVLCFIENEKLDEAYWSYEEV